jgi:hypothetical protein
MWRYFAGAASALLLAAAGFLFFRSGAEPGRPLFKPAPAARASAQLASEPLPAAAPAATEKTREQKRFDRYDKDRDGRITRDEYLVSRRKAFAKLDTNHDGKLSFEEWAIHTTTKFAQADADHSGALNAAEFLTTKVVRKTAPKPKCACPASDRGDD